MGKVEDCFLYRNKKFIRLLLALELSNAGDILYYLSLMSYAYTMKLSKFAVILVIGSETLPKLFTCFSGILVDKFNATFKTIFITSLIRGILFILIAYLMVLKKDLSILVIICCINLISDFLGEIANSTSYKAIPKIVKQEDFENANSIKNSLDMIVDFVINGISSLMILYYSNVVIAVINSITFFIVTLLFLPDKKYEINISNRSFKNKIKEICFIDEIKNTLTIIQNNRRLHNQIIFISIFNTFLYLVLPLYEIKLVESHSFQIINFTFNISFINITIACAVVFGSVLSTTLFKTKEINHLFNKIYLLLFILYISLLIENKLLTIISIFIVYMFDGILGPKFFTFVMLNIDESNISSSIGLINTFLIFISTISIFVFTALSTFMNINILIVYLIFSLLFTIYYFRKRGI